MTDPWLVLVAILALAGIYVLFPTFLHVYSRFRKGQTVDCPEKKEKTTVRVDAKLAAFSSLTGHQKLHVIDCPLWEDKKDCDQECVDQL